MRPLIPFPFSHPQACYYRPHHHANVPFSANDALDRPHEWLARPSLGPSASKSTPPDIFTSSIRRPAPRGRVNCVCPGWTRTPMAEYGLSDGAAVQRVQSTMALQKIAEPEDVAGAIVFLSSDRLAGHLSGTILPIAGGMEGRLLHQGP